MRIVPLILSVSLILAACGTSTPPSGNDGDETPVVVPAPPLDENPPLAPPEQPVDPSPTPPPPLDEPDPVEPPTDPAPPVEPPGDEPTPPAPAPPDGEPTPPAPPSEPTPPGEEPPAPPAQPAPPPTQPAPPSTPTPPSQPAPPPSQPAPPAQPAPPPPDEPTFTFTRSAGGPAPWVVSYTFDVPAGASVTARCEGYAYDISTNGATCMHDEDRQGLELTVTYADGSVLTQRIDGRVRPPTNGVPFYGTWTVIADAGDDNPDEPSAVSEFTITSKGVGTRGEDSNGVHFVQLDNDGTISMGQYGLRGIRFYASDDGQQHMTEHDGMIVIYEP